MFLKFKITAQLPHKYIVRNPNVYKINFLFFMFTNNFSISSLTVGISMAATYLSLLAFFKAFFPLTLKAK